MANNNDEEVPYRGVIGLDSVIEDTKFSKDEEEESTLRRVYKILKKSLDEIDKWHAFDLTETELKFKQQVVAHRMADNIVAPAFEEVRQALATIDEKFRQRNNK